MSWMPPVIVPATVVEATVHEQIMEDMTTRNDLGFLAIGDEWVGVQRLNRG
jgi:hypothetical protein